MILHLESGTCGSGIDMIDLNESAAICYQWKAYLHRGYRDLLLDRRDLQLWNSVTIYPFECPGCNTDFTKLSGLFQHVYSQSCNQEMNEGKIRKLINFLERRHSISGSESD